MIAKRIRNESVGLNPDLLEKFMCEIYPLGEIVIEADTGVITFSTGVPVSNGEPDLMIETGLYVDSEGKMQMFDYKWDGNTKR
jgi:hypothetical protein